MKVVGIGGGRMVGALLALALFAGSAAADGPVPGYKPPVVYHGGPVISHMTAQTVYWTPPGYPLPVGFAAGFDRLTHDFAVASTQPGNQFSVARQYVGPNGPALSTFTVLPSLVDARPFPKASCTTDAGDRTCISDTQIETELASFIKRYHLPSGSARTLTVVMPPGMLICYASERGHCSNNYFCGYHNYLTSLPAPTPYALVVVRPGCDYPGRTTPNGGLLDQADATEEHELIETATDPESNGYLNAASNEAVDLCFTFLGTEQSDPSGNDYSQVLNGDEYLLQEVWSPQAGTCQVSATTAYAAQLSKPSKVVSGRPVAVSATVLGDTTPTKSIRWQYRGSTASSPGRPWTGGTHTTVKFPHAGTFVLWATITDAVGGQTTGVERVTVKARPRRSHGRHRRHV